METAGAPSNSLDSTTRAEVINGLLELLQKHYVFPKVAEDMQNVIRQKLNAGEYDTVNSGEQLAQLLTTDMQEISKDKHLRVFYNTEESATHKDQEDEAQRNERWHAYWQLQNYGFHKVERLPGNIGYLDFRAFYPPDYAGDTAVAAMNFLAHTNTLIVDLRKNHGGEPTMIALISSYFFPHEPVHLNSLYWRSTDTTQQFWTLPYVPGHRYGNKPIYVLTSHETFSGAEEFTYNLKNLKRATVIGEVTGGGAHPGDIYSIINHFQVFIPNGRAISPITNTNWEGTGVTPDIEVPQEQALKTALVLALKQVIADIGDSPTPTQRTLQKEAQTALQELQ